MKATKVALITGAGKGLGKETAKELAKRGYTVILGGRNAQALTDLARSIAGDGGEARTLVLDLDRPETHREAAAQVSSWFGKLDLLVNNAGVMLEGSWQGNTAATVSLDLLKKTFETNFFGQVSLTQELIPLLEKGTAPQIINLGSLMGSLGVHADPQGPLADYKPFAYDASKTALNAFTIHLAAALKDRGIRVNSAHPGHVKTDMGGSYAPLEIEEGVKTVLELADEPAGGATGRYIHRGENLPW